MKSVIYSASAGCSFLLASNKADFKGFLSIFLKRNSIGNYYKN